MKLNIAVPNTMHVAAMTQAWEHQLAPIDIARAMQRADELGFHRAMLGEHFVIPDEHIALSGRSLFAFKCGVGVYCWSH